MMTKAQRIQAAMDRCDNRYVELLGSAERWAVLNRDGYAIACDRRALLKAARAYGRALAALTRVRN